MACPDPSPSAFHHPRNPRESPLFRLLEERCEEFERVYPERHQQRYGFFRPVIRKAVLDFLKCGDLREGFARVRCPDCRHELFVAYSCKQRCVCPSCHQKQSLQTGLHVSEDVCAAVPHRQFVFTVPRNLRPYFRQQRELLSALPLLAWETTRDVYAAAFGRAGLQPGMVTALQTFGELAHWHPHVHALVTDGAFDATGGFEPLPEVPAGVFVEVWRTKVFALLRRAGCINSRAIWVMRSWKHSGFSVDRSVRLHGSDRQAVGRIIQYMVRCPFSLERIVRVTPEGKVVYRTENAECRPFAFEGKEDTGKSRTVVRNFELFEPLDFIAEITQHVPDPGEHLIRYYGWYSNKSRGLRAKQVRLAARDDGVDVGYGPDPSPEPKPGTTRRRLRWAELIRRVYETDPLLCPKCGGAMKIISFIEKRDQAGTIEKILRHCGLWVDPPPARARPEAQYPPPVQLELLYVAEEDDVWYDSSG
jgi:ribosomal protein S27E